MDQTSKYGGPSLFDDQKGVVTAELRLMDVTGYVYMLFG